MLNHPSIGPTASPISTKVTPPTAQARTVLKLLGVALLYALLTQVSINYFSLNGRISLIWVPGGFALAAILLVGKRYAWSVLVGEVMGILFRGGALSVAVPIGMGNALAALLGVWLLQRSGVFDSRLRMLGDYLRLLGVAGVAGSLLSALVGVTTLWLHGFFPATAYATNLMNWWMGDVLGVALITPLLLIWRKPPVGWLEPARLLEIVMLMILVFAVGQVVFAGWFQVALGPYARGYWLFLVVAISTLRTGRHCVVLMVLMVAVQGLSAVLQGTGFFATGTPQMRLVNYWLYMLSLSGFGMVGATYFSELRLLQVKLAERERAYYRQFSDSNAVMLMLRRDGSVLDANKAALVFYGYANRAQMLALRIHDISCRTEQEISATLGELSHDVGRFFESRHRRADGTVRDVSVSSSPVIHDEQAALHEIITDITDRKRAEAEIESLAFYDPLTHLPNRRLLLDRLRQALAAATRSQAQGALLFIDLDNFKTLNDTHGHEKGDLLLQQTAQRLSACIRVDDTVARLGGDEFVVMLKDLSPHNAEAAAQVEAVGAKVLAALKLPYPLGGVEHQGSGSVGIALFGGLPSEPDMPVSTGESTVDELFKRADMALYQAKNMGRNTVCFFDPTMQAAVAARHALEVDLRLGLQQEQLVLHYQAQVNLQGELTGAEVLVRWQHPVRGMVSPAQFIPLAEESGLIVPLGHWVLKTACLQLAAWATEPPTARLTLSVNVSARQFRQSEFVQEVLDVVARTGAPAARLKLELTESMLVDDVDDIIAKMIALKTQGVGFSLDDFGTGYSSLSYLKRLPLDQLKIDQTFVRDALTDPNDAVITKTIVALGQSLGLNVIAEGVETQAQRDFLAAQGCYAYQGYFFGRPGPVEGLLALMTQSAAAVEATATAAPALPS